MAVAVTRMDLSARELRAASSKTRDAKTARRMLAIALVLEGMDRKTAAESCGMDRQTLRDWVHRYTRITTSPTTISTPVVTPVSAGISAAVSSTTSSANIGRAAKLSGTAS